jgi:MFS family permease
MSITRRPGVARLGVAGLLSETGDWMLFIALPLYVLQLTGSPLVTATVFALELLPTVLAGPLAGVLVDRCDPWRLMSGTAALQAVFLLPLLLVDSAADLWLVYAVVVVESVLATIIEPSRAATAAALVPSGERMAVNQALGVLSSVARLVGGPLGGLILGMRGIDAVLIVDALTFLGVAALLVRRRERPARTTARPHPLRDWAEGFAVVTRTPALRRAIGVVACMALAQGAFVVLFVLFVVRDLGGSESDVGVLRGVQAAGALGGGALLSLVIGRWEPGRVVAISLAAFGILSLTIWNAPAITTAFGVYVGLFIAAGVPAIATMTGLLTLLQEHAPEAARGRVMSTFFAVYGGVQAAGMLLAGVVGTGSGLTVALQVQGGLYLAAAALALRGHRLASSPWISRPRRPTSSQGSSGSTPSTRPATSVPARSG